MYVFIGLSGPKSSQILSVQCVDAKSDNDALCYALTFVSDNEVSLVEIWDDKENEMVCRLEV